MFEIAGRRIGYGHTPLISCDLSLNHQGDLDLALKMIDQIAEAGADAVKLQWCRVEDSIAGKPEMITYKSYRQPKYPETSPSMPILEETTEPIADLFTRCDIDIDFLKACRKRAKEHGLIFHVTTMNAERIPELVELGVDCFKVASDSIDNFEMISEMRRNWHIPVIISAGQSDLSQVEPERHVFRNTIMLHCVSSYPAREPQLWKLTHLQQLGYLAGYSDHTEGIKSAIRATEMGAVWVEKHFTLDKTMSGPDHYFSANPAELRALVAAVK